LKRWKKPLHLSLRLITGMLCGLLLILTGVALILARPDAPSESAPQPVLTQEAPLTASEELELKDLAEHFPVSFMSFLSGSGLQFLSASVESVPFEGGFGRRLLSRWGTGEGETVLLESIYPARALSLITDPAFHFSGVSGPTLFGQPSVRMESADHLRLHLQTESGLYVCTLPLSAAGRLGDLVRSLQLFSISRE